MPDLYGSLRLTGDCIEWQVHSDLLLSIAIDGDEGYIDVNRGLFHWHPSTEDVWDELLRIGKRGNVLIIRKTPLHTELYYSGPKENCPAPKRRCFDRLYRFGT